MVTTTPPAWLGELAARAERGDLAPLARSTAPDGIAARHSAVLMLFGPAETDGANNGMSATDVLLTERAHTLRSHPGQPAFPGGAIDPGDAGPADAAVREAVEETGLEPDGVDVLATLPQLWLPPSGFVVTPVLGWWRAPSPVRVMDPAEVASVHRVPVSELVDPSHRLQVRHRSGYFGPAFRVRGLLVWGFTAGILSAVLESSGLAQPWDTARVEDLPDAAHSGWSKER